MSGFDALGARPLGIGPDGGGSLFTQGAQATTAPAASMVPGRLAARQSSSSPLATLLRSSGAVRRAVSSPLARLSQAKTNVLQTRTPRFGNPVLIASRSANDAANPFAVTTEDVQTDSLIVIVAACDGAPFAIGSIQDSTGRFYTGVRNAPNLVGTADVAVYEGFPATPLAAGVTITAFAGGGVGVNFNKTVLVFKVPIIGLVGEPTDAFPAPTTGVGTVLSVSTPALAQAGELVLGVALYATAGNAYTEAPGFASLGSGTTGFGLRAATLATRSQDVQTFAPTLGSSDTWGALIFSFKTGWVSLASLNKSYASTWRATTSPLASLARSAGKLVLRNVSALASLVTFKGSYLTLQAQSAVPPVNQVVWSNDLSQAAAWNVTSELDRTAGQPTVSGNTGTLLKPTTATNLHYTQQNVTLENVPYALQFKGKANGYRWLRVGFDGLAVSVDTLTGAIGSTTGGLSSLMTPTLDGQGFWQFQFTGTPAAGATSLPVSVNNADSGGTLNFPGDGVSSLIIADLQLEKGSVCTALRPNDATLRPGTPASLTALATHVLNALAASVVVATLARFAAKALRVTSAPVASILARLAIAKFIQTSTTPPATLARAVTAIRVATSTPTASLKSAVSATRQAIVSPVATLTRGAAIIRRVTSAPVASLIVAPIYAAILRATTAPVATLVRMAVAVRSATTAPAASLTRSALKPVPTSTGPVASLTRSALVIRLATTVVAASLAKSLARVFGAVTAPVASGTRSTAPVRKQTTTAPVASGTRQLIHVVTGFAITAPVATMTYVHTWFMRRVAKFQSGRRF